MSYKPRVRCPIDRTRLPKMIASTHEYETYHCLICNTYWHVYWEEYRKPRNIKRLRIVLIRDDYGKTFNYPPEEQL